MYNPILIDPYKKEISQDPYSHILKKKHSDKERGDDNERKKDTKPGASITRSTTTTNDHATTPGNPKSILNSKSARL